MEKTKKRKYVSVSRTPKKDQPHKNGVSSFARFIVALKGYDLYIGSKQIEKWQAFHLHEKDAKKILEGKSKITSYLHRPEILEIK